jgi:hypothetical protein
LSSGGCCAQFKPQHHFGVKLRAKADRAPAHCLRDVGGPTPAYFARFWDSDSMKINGLPVRDYGRELSRDHIHGAIDSRGPASDRNYTDISTRCSAERLLLCYNVRCIRNGF